MAIQREKAKRVRVELQLDPDVAERLRSIAADEQRNVSVVAQRLLASAFRLASELSGVSM